MTLTPHTSADYLRATLQLLDPGLAWSAEPDSVMYRVLGGYAPGFARLDTDAVALIPSTFPATATDLLPNWESTLGLPDACQGLNPTLATRQSQVVARLQPIPSVNLAYLQSYASTLGFAIRIKEYSGFTAGVSVAGGRVGSSNSRDVEFAITIFIENVAVSLEAIQKTFALLPTSLPTTPGTLYNNGGAICITAGLSSDTSTFYARLSSRLSGLPTTDPLVSGQLYTQSGVLCISAGKNNSTVYVQPLADAYAPELSAIPTIQPNTPGALWCDGGVVCVNPGSYGGNSALNTTLASLTNSVPQTAGTLYNNGGFVCITPGTYAGNDPVNQALSQLPTSMPITPGTLYNNGNVVCITPGAFLNIDDLYEIFSSLPATLPQTQATLYNNGLTVCHTPVVDSSKIPQPANVGVIECEFSKMLPAYIAAYYLYS